MAAVTAVNLAPDTPWVRPGGVGVQIPQSGRVAIKPSLVVTCVGSGLFTVTVELFHHLFVVGLVAGGWQVLGLLVPVGWASLLYTSGLSTQWSAGGLTPSMWVGNLILKHASRLDAFSGYHSRT